MAVAAGVLWKLRWRINLLALEERDARSLGVPVGQQATMVGAHQQTGEVRDHQSHPGDAAADRHLRCHPR
jgi:hypothetical protein